MAKYYVTGGAQRKKVKDYIEWFSYGEASIFVFDDADGSMTKCASYITPDEIRPEDKSANIVFKAGSLNGNRLLVCTQTEILAYSLPDFKQVGYTTHPWLNDVHHVVVNEAGNYLIANTGLDMVLELTPDGEVVREISVLPGKDIWDRFDKDIDYRKVTTTKPHHAHPNYVFEINGELWVSRFVQKDVICLSNPEKIIDIGIEKVHDGNVYDGKVYFTAVDGHVVIADPVTCEVLAVHDLNAMTDTNKTLGWCRGLHILDDDRILVGFSRLRPSKFRENVQWVKFQVGKRESAGKLPTRVALYDLKAGRMEWDINLEKHQLNAVFSILPAD
ncbi:MAG: hypothetical protein ABFS42_08955 [Candidatus Krumholzibacteriota bacterium]